MSTSRSLKELLQADEFVVAPGVYDGLSALVADGENFGALYLSGYAVSASLLGKPDAGFLTATHMVDRVRTICSIIKTPVIADADTGFGGLHQVAETVRAFEAGGAAAIQIEDQAFPKRCGHTLGRPVIDSADAAAKIRMAVEARSSDEFLVIARTDARTSLGLGEALRRGEAFLKAGADIIFIESPETEGELAEIGRAFEGAWLLANMVSGGRTPTLASHELKSFGFNISIHPLIALSAVAECLKVIYGNVPLHKEQHEMPFSELNRLVGFEELWALDERFCDIRKDE